MVLPVGEFVARAGLDQPERALPLLAALTPRFSSEFALRPFIAEHPDVTFRFLQEWVTHPDEQVRRLVSEGTRPRLPWAARLRTSMADPRRTIELLDRLFDDPSPSVRRSVANHLNDISKDHPALAVEIARRWVAASPSSIDVARHGLRSLVKAGDSAALHALGYSSEHHVELVELGCTPTAVQMGGTVRLRVTVRAEETIRAAIDYVVYYQGVNGLKGGKVFKLTTCELPAGELVTFQRQHRFAHVSIRRIHPGPHRIELQVNGRVLGAVELEVC